MKANTGHIFRYFMGLGGVASVSKVPSLKSGGPPVTGMGGVG